MLKGDLYTQPSTSPFLTRGRADCGIIGSRYLTAHSEQVDRAQALTGSNTGCDQCEGTILAHSEVVRGPPSSAPALPPASPEALEVAPPARPGQD